MKSAHPIKSLFDSVRSTLPDKSERNKKVLEGIDEKRLKTLYELSNFLNQILRPDLLLDTIGSEVARHMAAERVVIILKEDDELKIRSTYNTDDRSERDALQYSRSVVKNVLDEYQPLFKTDTITSDSLSQYATLQKHDIHFFICVPIMVNLEAIGTIYVDSRRLDKPLRQSDVPFLQALANLIGIAIRNSLAYQHIRELNESLEKKVEERTADLQQTLDQLRQTQQKLIITEKMASIGRLIGGFLHEFNNPINFIYSNLPHLKDYARNLLTMVEKALGELNPQEREQLEREFDYGFIRNDLQRLIEGVEEGARRTRELIEDLRSIAGADSRKTRVIDWKKHLDKTVSFLKARNLAPFDLRLNIPGGLLVKANPMEIHQSIYNILQNALDAGATQIILSAFRKNNTIVCTIQDNGPGIEPDKIKRIFEPFYTTKKIGKGMGLGLSLAYSAIIHHGGSLDVESEPGKGTTFKIILPLVNSEHTEMSQTEKI